MKKLFIGVIILFFMVGCSSNDTIAGPGIITSGDVTHYEEHVPILKPRYSCEGEIMKHPKYLGAEIIRSTTTGLNKKISDEFLNPLGYFYNPGKVKQVQYGGQPVPIPIVDGQVDNYNYPVPIRNDIKPIKSSSEKDLENWFGAIFLAFLFTGLILLLLWLLFMFARLLYNLYKKNQVDQASIPFLKEFADHESKILQQLQKTGGSAVSNNGTGYSYSFSIPPKGSEAKKE